MAIDNIRISVDFDADGLPDFWEIKYFGDFTNAMSAIDFDSDRLNNLAEYISGHDPTNSGSVFKVNSFTPPSTGSTPVTIAWGSVSGRIYNVEWSDNLIHTTFTNISGDLPYPTHSYTDTVERAGLQNFYRVNVQLDQ